MTKRKRKQLSRAERIASRIDRLPRFTRIMLNMMISILVMAVIGFPLVLLFGENRIDEGGVQYLPTIIIALVWFGVYAYGWRSLVGFDWDPDESWHAEMPAVWMVVLGITALFLLVLELAFGLLFGYVL
ncbi:MAG: hypothetical protein GYB66_03250 [Chloroflexi bacterium]|nr:hypothetical protein [Chloroflexota bacterium]